ncbi:hypothetical protein H8A97_11980 [Bradyrhizobium sp. Arg62]|uniref:hypothetical protein n=1 Tax=Bradyrhizobium brasilense TaxID=1419277 RepID=UPI001E3CA7B5|nr:hypothetical protein [Bradyrhizobium brasilense]MCC8945794.1 hypothetical protein [Bradyrhizobium brasilense]
MKPHLKIVGPGLNAGSESEPVARIRHRYGLHERIGQRQSSCGPEDNEFTIVALNSNLNGAARMSTSDDLYEAISSHRSFRSVGAIASLTEFAGGVKTAFHQMNPENQEARQVEAPQPTRRDAESQLLYVVCRVDRTSDKR